MCLGAQPNIIAGLEARRIQGTPEPRLGNRLKIRLVSKENTDDQTQSLLQKIDLV